MRRWNLILRVFMSEYLNLRPENANTPSTAREEQPASVQKSNGELVSSSIF